MSKFGVVLSVFQTQQNSNLHAGWTTFQSCPPAQKAPCPHCLNKNMKQLLWYEKEEKLTLFDKMVISPLIMVRFAKIKKLSGSLEQACHAE